MVVTAVRRQRVGRGQEASACSIYHSSTGALACAASKLEKAADWLDNQSHAGSRGGGLRAPHAAALPANEKDSELARVVRDCAKLAEGQLKGLASQSAKLALFNRAPLDVASAPVADASGSAGASPMPDA